MTEPIRKPLITVERQFETDLETGETSVRMFVKMYFAARDSGLLRTIPDELWKTLCILATYMDEYGVCNPSQATIARELGITRSKLNRRIQRLLAFRFGDRAVLSLRKTRNETSSGGRWANNVYTIHPIAGFGIFDRPTRKPVCPQGNTGQGPVFPQRNTREGHTNQSVLLNQTHTVCDDSNPNLLIAQFLKLRGSPDRVPRKRELEQAKALVARVGERRAREVVEFAVGAAKKTRFEMRHFGAVLGYEAEALASGARHAAVSRVRAKQSARKLQLQEDSQYQAWREAALDRHFESLPLAEQNQRRELAQAAVQAERGPSPLGFQTLVRIEVRAALARDFPLPTQPEWRDEPRDPDSVFLRASGGGPRLE